MRIWLGLRTFLFAAGMISSHSAIAGEVLCPRSFAHPVTQQSLPLANAELWAAEYQISIEDAEEHRDFGRRFWGRWQLRMLDHPRFIVCRYGAYRDRGSRPQVVFPIPEGADTCEMEARERKEGPYIWDVLKFVCSGVPAEKWKAHAAEKPNRSTELGGMNLAMTRAQIEAHILASGGTVTADGQRLAIQVKDESFFAYFTPNAEHPSRIVALLPPRMGDSKDAYFSLVQRYGTIYPANQTPNPRWEGRDGVWFVYKPGRPNTDDRQEIHLIDGKPDEADAMD